MTRNYWRYRSDDVSSKGWLTPLPDIPDNAQIKKSVNWTVPKTITNSTAPTKSGKATIRIESVRDDHHAEARLGCRSALVDFKSKH